jgi:hypothetical protein
MSESDEFDSSSITVVDRTGADVSLELEEDEESDEKS